MKFKNSIIRLLTTNLLLTFCLIEGCGQQMTFNYNFESLDLHNNPKGWVLNKTPSYSIKLDNIIKIEGKYSLAITKIDDGASFGSAIYQIPGTFQGKEIELKGYIKSENVANGFAALWMRIDGPDGVLAFDNMSKIGLKGTTDWAEYSIKLPYDDEHANKIVIGGLLVGSGKVWIDDIRLYIDGEKIEKAKTKQISLTRAQKDTAFANKSGIDTILLNSQQLTNLTVLGQVWGFLKYYHPAVKNGNYNLDAELFRILPSVTKATSNSELSDTIEHWVDKLGKPDTCKTCTMQTNENIIYKPDYGSIFNNSLLNKSLIKKLAYILNNHNSSENYYVDLTEGIGNPIFRHELTYDAMSYPDAGYRLLCLFRYWNMIQYFYPYKHLIGSDWDEILAEFLPRFIKAHNKTDYVLATLSLISSVNDTHANIWSINPSLESFRGANAVPVQARFIQKQLVVTGYYADTLQVKKLLVAGDVILNINGIAVEKLIKKYLPITAASNYSTKLRDLPVNYLLRSNKKIVTLKILRGDSIKTLSVPAVEANRLNRSIDYNPKPNEPAYKILVGQIGYVFAGKYKNQDLPLIKNIFANTKGIIVDMRCYPSDFMPFTFVSYIAIDTYDFAKIISGSMENPGTFKESQTLKESGTNEYKGKVVVIVNEYTQSQAEFTTMALQSSPNVTVIGSTTAGADGNVSSITLPGGINTMISGIGISYPDRTESQRRGVKINYVIKPTIKGIREGRDELLDKAREIIQAK